ncbi:PREDICTED: formin-like protein 18 [Nicotiana attenuata]|uniref:formin-like protein 18 n=1 Tax=Nicotiana attenuata TaxID=49451 RepID=UPI0009059517|nr:PREDICTED: formin-like protein 18 [Nicotiana attenuata]
MARLQLISNQAQQISKASPPPPPPFPSHPPLPPPLPLSTPCKTGGLQRSVLSTTSPQMVKTTSRSSTPKTTPGSEDTRPSEEENGDASSLDRHDSGDTDPSKPKLKPLHWDKVRASSGQSKFKDHFSNSKLHMDFREIKSGFAIRGVTVEAIIASRDSLSTPTEEEDSEKEDEGSLVMRPRARRRIVSDDEAEVSPHLSLSEPVVAPVIIPDDDIFPHDTRESINQFFVSGFGSGNLGPVARDSQSEANNWKEQFDSAQIDMEDLQERRSTLEQQVRALTSELAVIKASSSQAEKERERLESSFSEQLSKASEEIRALKDLLNQKEIYAGELVQNLTKTQEDLRASVDKVHALESSHATLQSSYSSVLAENEELKNEVSWAFLNSRRDTLLEMGQESFNLESELAKVNETIERAQQTQDFSSPEVEAPVIETPLAETPVVEVPVNAEIATGVSPSLSPIVPLVASQAETSSVGAPVAVNEDQLATVDDPAQVEPVDDPSLVLSS